MKKIDVAFAVIVLAILTLPIARFDFKDSVSLVENRKLAAMPSFVKDGKFNESFFTDFDSYFKDRFCGRKFFVGVSNSIDFGDRKKNRLGG